MFDTLHVHIDITSNHPILRYNGTPPPISTPSSPASARRSRYRLAVLRRFEIPGVYPLNRASPSALARQAARAAAACARGRRPARDHLLAHGPRRAEDVIRRSAASPSSSSSSARAGVGVILGGRGSAGRSSGVQRRQRRRHGAGVHPGGEQLRGYAPSWSAGEVVATTQRISRRRSAPTCSRAATAVRVELTAEERRRRARGTPTSASTCPRRHGRPPRLRDFCQRSPTGRTRRHRRGRPDHQLPRGQRLLQEAETRASAQVQAGHSRPAGQLLRQAAGLGVRQCNTSLPRSLPVAELRSSGPEVFQSPTLPGSRPRRPLVVDPSSGPDSATSSARERDQSFRAAEAARPRWRNRPPRCAAYQTSRSTSCSRLAQVQPSQTHRGRPPCASAGPPGHGTACPPTRAAAPGSQCGFIHRFVPVRGTHRITEKTGRSHRCVAARADVGAVRTLPPLHRRPPRRRRHGRHDRARLRDDGRGQRHQYLRHRVPGEARDRSDEAGEMAAAAAALCDLLSDGISMVYSFYDRRPTPRASAPT